MDGAGVEPQAVQVAFGSEQVNPAVVNQRHAAWAVVRGDRGLICGRETLLPERLAAGGVEGLDNCLVAQAMKKHHPATQNRHAGVTVPDRTAPDDVRPGGGPTGVQVFVGRDPVVRGPRICGHSPAAAQAARPKATASTRAARVLDPRRASLLRRGERSWSIHCLRAVGRCSIC